jgi:hypothetical protein
LWYIEILAAGGAIMALFNCSDGLIQFRTHRVEALSSEIPYQAKDHREAGKPETGKPA